jgi:hypothetical protein
LFCPCSSGFHAVYRITDLPSLVSGAHIAYFDPHCQVRELRTRFDVSRRMPCRNRRGRRLPREGVVPVHGAAVAPPPTSAALTVCLLPRAEPSRSLQHRTRYGRDTRGAENSTQGFDVTRHASCVSNSPGHLIWRVRLSGATCGGLGIVTGKRIDFAAYSVRQQFPDQFEPYRIFGCTMEVSAHAYALHCTHLTSERGGGVVGLVGSLV